MHRPHRSAEERLNAKLHTPEAILPAAERVKPRGKKEHFWSWVITFTLLAISVLTAAVVVCVILP